MDPIALILGLLVAAIVCVILYLIIVAVLQAMGVGEPWLKIARLIVLLLFLLWVIGIIFGGYVPFPIRARP